MAWIHAESDRFVFDGDSVPVSEELFQFVQSLNIPEMIAAQFTDRLYIIVENNDFRALWRVVKYGVTVVAYIVSGSENQLSYSLAVSSCEVCFVVALRLNAHNDMLPINSEALKVVERRLLFAALICRDSEKYFHIPPHSVISASVSRCCT